MNVKRILAVKGTHVVTIHPAQLVREAVALLVKHKIGALVVVGEESRPVGIISERDIIRRAAQNEQVFAETVGELMTRELITGLPQDDLHSVANTLTEKRIRHLPIVENGQLVGIISIGDVVKAQRDYYLGEVDTLQTQILADKS